MKMLTDYSSMENEIKNAPEPTAIKKGTEVRARIIGVRTGEVEKEGDYTGFAYFSVSYDAPDEPLAKEFSDFFWDLSNRSKMSEKDFMNALRKFRTFAEAFGLDYSKPFDLEDELPGKVGWLITGKPKESDEYGLQTTVSKYIGAPANAGSGPAPNLGEAPF
jgi:hypothetical protein